VISKEITDTLKNQQASLKDLEKAYHKNLENLILCKVALAYYADIGNWQGNKIQDDIDRGFVESNSIYIGGERARKCLMRIMASELNS
jgi:hypothetical protein